MNKLKLFFEGLLKRFADKKIEFKQRLKQLEDKGKKKLHKQGAELLADIERLEQEIKLEIDSENSVEKTKEIKQKIKNLDKNYKHMREAVKTQTRQWVEAIVITGIAAFLLRTFIFGLYHVPTGSAEPTVLVGDRVWGNKMAYYFGNKPKHGDLVIFDNPEFIYNRSNKLKSLWQNYIGLAIPFLGIEAGPINLVKRVIAVPGDWIEGRVEDGRPVIYLNGRKLKESYVNKNPLKLVQRSVGFINFPLAPGFLRKHTKIVRYTYVPGMPYEDQPYYYMTKRDILHVDQAVDLISNWPHTPSLKSNGVIADSFGPLKIPEGKYWAMGDSRKNSRDSRWFQMLDKKLIHGRLSFIIYSVDSEEPMWFFELIKHPIDFWLKFVRWNRFFKKPKVVFDDETNF
jgi:signal peptidase I